MTSKHMTPEQWAQSVSTSSYCHYFTVAVASDDSPIGYHPSTESTYFYTIDEAIELKKELGETFNDASFLIISGAVSSQFLENSPFTKWAKLHSERLANLEGINNDES